MKIETFFPMKQINGEKSEKKETAEKGKCAERGSS